MYFEYETNVVYYMTFAKKNEIEKKKCKKRNKPGLKTKILYRHIYSVYLLDIFFTNDNAK